MPFIYDRPQFWNIARGKVFAGHVTDEQVQGTEAIITAWEKLQPEADTRFVACSLGTAEWETGHTMQPVREGGKGRGHGYGVPAGPWHQVYYGRGDVQDTWYVNYAKQDPLLHKLGVLTNSESLVRTPDLALRPDVAAAIMIYGMIDGWFTGKKLSDYFGAHGSDWVGSRRIINSLDHAETIALTSEHFYAALITSRRGATLPAA